VQAIDRHRAAALAAYHTGHWWQGTRLWCVDALALCNWWWQCDGLHAFLSQTVVVLDPDLSKDYLDLIQNRTKERRYTFDHVYAPGCSNSVCDSEVWSALISNCLACFRHWAQSLRCSKHSIRNLHLSLDSSLDPNFSFLASLEMMLRKTKPPTNFIINCLN
jgi:hypothetical protein